MIFHHSNDGFCTFCNEFNGSEHCNFRTLFSVDELKSRIIYRSEHFVIIPALGPIGDFNLLVLPFHHYSRLSSLPLELYPQLDSVKLKLTQVVSSIHSKPIYFEHGSTKKYGIGAGCCEEHAHMHSVCVPFDLAHELFLNYENGVFGFHKRFHPCRIESIYELEGWALTGVGYLYYENAENQKYGFPIVNEIRPQFMRRIILEKLGQNQLQWDWALFPKPSEVVELWHRLSSLF